MKKMLLLVTFLVLLSCTLIACNGELNASSETPTDAITHFLDALKSQDYSSVKPYYAESLENMEHFKNKIETISPHLTSELFSKMSDFSYEIQEVAIDPKAASKATALISIDYHDLGNAFEKTILEFTKTDLEMTFDGSTNDEISKKIEETLIKDISKSNNKITEEIICSLTYKDSWTLDSIKDNPALLNALTGNIIHTINQMLLTLNAI